MGSVRCTFALLKRGQRGDDMSTSYWHGRLKEYLRRGIQMPKLLMIDEVGYLPFPREETSHFFQ